jgi:Tol biopolymer transport system component
VHFSELWTFIIVWLLSQEMRSTRLTESPADDIAAALVSDGNRLAFLSDREGAYDVFIMNDDGSDQQKVTDEAGSQVPILGP